MTILFFFTIFLFVLGCVILSGVILIQEGKGGGLGALAGDASDSLFGTSTADVLKSFTGWLAVIFLVACVILSLWTEVMGRSAAPSTPGYGVESVER